MSNTSDYLRGLQRQDHSCTLTEAYSSIYSTPKSNSINEGDLMLDLVSKITSTFTSYYPIYNQLQENTVRFICQGWEKGFIKKELLERTLGRARTQNNKAVNTFLEYLESGIYDNGLKTFVKDNILTSLVTENKIDSKLTCLPGEQQVPLVTEDEEDSSDLDSLYRIITNRLNKLDIINKKFDDHIAVHYIDKNYNIVITPA